jgi:hypothetical protein
MSNPHVTINDRATLSNPHATINDPATLSNPRASRYNPHFQQDLRSQIVIILKKFTRINLYNFGNVYREVLTFKLFDISLIYSDELPLDGG